MGDHPNHDSETLNFPKPLPAEELYVELDPERWISLDPFIRVEPCPKCERRETYFLDRWDKEQKVYELKSFECRHSLFSQDVARLVDDWATAAPPEPKPVPITSEEPEPISQEAATDAQFELNPGDVVTVVDGPFSGFSVEVLEIQGTSVDGLFSAFGSPTPVHLEPGQFVLGGQQPVYQSAVSLLTAAEKKTIRETIVDVLRSSAKPLKARQIAPLVQKRTGVPVDRAMVNHFLRVPTMRELVEQNEEYCWRLR